MTSNIIMLMKNSTIKLIKKDFDICDVINQNYSELEKTNLVLHFIVRFILRALFCRKLRQY